MKTIYLAHTLGLREYVKTKIQPVVEKYFFVTNPFEGRHEELEPYGTDEEAIRKNLKRTDRWIVTHDLRDVSKCDGVLAFNPKGASYGSMFEVCYAIYKLGLPVAFIVKPEYIHHPWLNYYAVSLGIEEDLEKVCEYLEEMVIFRDSLVLE